MPSLVASKPAKRFRRAILRRIGCGWLRPVVIGPKWDKGEWGGCYLIGGNGDFEAVERGIALVRKLVEQRHADTTKRHKEHSIQPIFFDDWTPIVDAVHNARALVLEATTLYASVNVLLYFILHSDTANAWGVDRKGAALKDNFIKLVIQPVYSDNGLIIRSQTKGFIQFTGDSTERPAQLFTTPPMMVGKPVVIPFEQCQDSEAMQDRYFASLVRQGISRNKASMKAYSRPYAGNLVARGKAALGEL
jgi:hypothetical protein